MNLMIILLSGTILSVIFHFIGVYADAKKTVWSVIFLLWAAAVSIAMSEIKPKGYTQIENMKGNNPQTDLLITQAQPKISIYEMLEIKKSFHDNKKKI